VVLSLRDKEFQTDFIKVRENTAFTPFDCAQGERGGIETVETLPLVLSVMKRSRKTQNDF
jgi:hypothetical protein